MTGYTNRYIVTLLLMLFCTFIGQAQKKQINEAEDQVKSGKNLDKAEKSMRELLKKESNRTNDKIWLILLAAEKKQYDQGNEKLYLKEKYDTASLFEITRRLFKDASTFDSIYSRPDKNGRIDYKYRERISRQLHVIRPNLFNGGAYYISHKEYRMAFSYFDEFIQTANLPLFANYDYLTKDELLPHAAYWSMYCGYKLSDDSLIMRHSKLAERHTDMLNFVRQYEAEAYRIKGDTSEYVRALKEGFEDYPNFIYFFPRLIDYYGQTGQNEEAMKVADRALAIDSTNIVFRFAKSNVLLNTGHYDECIRICKKLIEENDSLADAYYNIGIAYFNQAVQMDKVRQRNRKKIMYDYENARPYLERYRQLAPDQYDKWIAPLYTIYLNLNMGKEFDEIEKTRNEYRRNNH
jgi:hypothetical protein